MSQPTPSVNESNPILTYYQEWSERTPFVTRYAVIIMIVTYILSFFFEFDRQLGNIPYFTIINFEIYRIILSPLVGNSFLSIIMILLFFPTMGGRIESSIGSGSYLHLIFLFSVTVNIFFLITCFGLYAAGVFTSIFWNCSGFWTILFSFITLECLQMPEVPRQIMFIPVNIPSKYFPLALYVFFSIFSGPDLGLALSIVVGYMHFKGYLDRFRPSSYYLASLETPAGIFYSLSRSRGWVLAGASLGHDSWIPVNTNVDRQTDNIQPSSHSNVRGLSSWRTAGQDDSNSNPNPKESTAFAGAGRTLSSGTSTYSAISTSISKEAVAAKRLAALSNSSDNKEKEKRIEFKTTDKNLNLEKLIEMGFNRSDAIRALEKSNGDINLAMQLLTT